MNLQKREVQYLYEKKIKEGLSPSMAYAQIKKAKKYQSKITAKKLKKGKEKKDFKSKFNKLISR